MRNSRKDLPATGFEQVILDKFLASETEENPNYHLTAVRPILSRLPAKNQIV